MVKGRELNVRATEVTEILVDRVCKVTEGLIDDEQGGFRAGKVCIDH